MVGTIGPLVQGGLPRMRWRLQLTALFVTAFLIGAVAIFFLFFLLGITVQISGLSLSLKRGVAAAGLVSLALMDLWARRNKTYCPIRRRRQTSRGLRFRHSMFVVAPIWGFDMGLAITTIRVTGATWGAILLTLLGLSGWQTGIAYGFAFVIPITILMWTHRLGRSEEAQKPGDAGLSELLKRGFVWQTNSAAILVAGGVLLLCEILIGAT